MKLTKVFTLSLLTIVMSVICISYTDDSLARRSSGGFKSSGSSFGGFKSRRVSRPKPVKAAPRKQYSSYKKTTTSRTAKPVKVKKQKAIANRGTTKSTTQKYGANVKGKQSVATSKSAYKKQQAAFKPKPKTVARSGAGNSRSTTNRNTGRNTVHQRRSTTIVVNNYNLNRYDRSTYLSRRGSYYGGWHTPSYAYSGYSSYGVYDSIALYHMVSHRNNYGMWYHHRRDPGMIAWRLEANRQARNNAELRSQLAAMDTHATGMQGTAIQSNYMPEGVDADIFMSAETMEDAKAVLRVCTGPQQLNYHNVAKYIGKQSTTVTLIPISTNGTGENLAKLDSGECDGAFVQRDGYEKHIINNPLSELDYERIASPYAEVLQLVCNKDSGVEELSDLSSKHTVLIGTKGSGSAVTWANVVAQNDDYEDVNTSNVSGTQAVTRMANDQADCMLVVSGIGNKLMTHINRVGKTTTLNLVEWDDTSIKGTIGPSGKPVYAEFTLPSGTYDTLQTNNFIGSMQVDTDSITVPADFIINNSWAKANATSYEQFVIEVTEAVPNIRKYVSGRR